MKRPQNQTNLKDNSEHKKPRTREENAYSPSPPAATQEQQGTIHPPIPEIKEEHPDSQPVELIDLEAELEVTPSFLMPPQPTPFPLITPSPYPHAPVLSYPPYSILHLDPLTILPSPLFYGALASMITPSPARTYFSSTCTTATSFLVMKTQTLKRSKILAHKRLQKK